MPFFQDGNVTPQAVTDAVKKLKPFEDDLYKKTDDISLARLFADVFASVARYNVNSRSWYVYDGVKWNNDVESMKTERFAKLLSRALLLYSADVEDTAYRNYIVKLGDRRRREVMLKDARDFYPVKFSDFDNDPYLFNCQNCVIDLRTCQPIEHSPDLLLSKVSNVVYKPEAKSECFESFLDAVMMGVQTKVDYLKHLFGYALLGENRHEEMYLVYGSTTRNGKSTLLDTIGHLFGDYSANIMPETLAQQKERNSRQASGDIARLDGVRFLHCGEPPKRMRLEVALVKSLTGNDLITARHLNEREFQFTPVFKLFINTNFLPVVNDDSLFSSGRVKVISFDRHFTPEEQDTKLKPRLREEDNISGIFNWCLDGLRAYYEDGENLDPPQAVKIATDEYREKSDKLLCFMEDYLIPSENNCITGGNLYEYYRQWCRKSGFGEESKSNFFDELRGKNLLVSSATIDGKTVRNVVKGFAVDPEVCKEGLTDYFE